jgi:hypothetical protein
MCYAGGAKWEMSEDSETSVAERRMDTDGGG